MVTLTVNVPLEETGMVVHTGVTGRFVHRATELPEDDAAKPAPVT